jgi:DNA-binding IclR family transcriptional regulator
MEMSLLQALASSAEALSIGELRDKTGMAPATLNRQLKRLTEAGYIVKVRHGAYAVGGALISLSLQVMQHSGCNRYLPLMHELVRRTGLNAELYLLNGAGPTLLNWLGGVSEFRVRMSPGHPVSHPRHPAIAFYLAAHPEAPQAWSQPRNAVEPDWIIRAKTDGFLMEMGRLRPELARACLLLEEPNYCLGLSGLVSEFTLNEQDIRRLIKEENVL